MTDYRKIIDQYVDLLEIPEGRQFITPAEAEKRAGSFLRACAHMTELRNVYGKMAAGAETLKRTAFRIALINAKGKNAVESKAIAEADPDYQKECERVSELEHEIQYFRDHYQNFMNAHIHYRQYANELHKEGRNNAF